MREREASPSAILAIATLGHLAAAITAALTALPRTNAVALGLACSTLAIVACTELAPAPRAHRLVRAILAGHAVAAAALVLAPALPSAAPLAALGLAAALGAASLVLIRRRAIARRPPRPLALTPRVAAIALIAQAAIQLWLASSPELAMPVRAALLLALAGLATAVLVSLTLLTLHLRQRWLLAGLIAWALGWIATTADLAALIRWALGAPYPVGPHQLAFLDAELVQIIATLGGLAIGIALITAMREPRFRHSALILLAGYVLFGVLAAIGEHRIELAANLPSSLPLRKDRDLTAAITQFALAGVLWMYWRRVEQRLSETD